MLKSTSYESKVRSISNRLFGKINSRREEIGLSSLFKRNLLAEDSTYLINILSEAIRSGTRKGKKFVEYCFTCIDLSKNNEDYAINASNAITVLNRAEINFSYRDFSDIQIPNADLSFSICYQTKFNGADMSRCNFQNAYLNEASFDGAIMKNVNFGIMASIIWPTGCVTSVIFTPNGKHLIAAGDPNHIIMYDVQTGNIIREFVKHSSRITSIEIDDTGKFLISRSEHPECITYIWDIETSAASVVSKCLNPTTFVPNDRSKIAYTKASIFEGNTTIYQTTICENAIKFCDNIEIVSSSSLLKDLSYFGPVILEDIEKILSIKGYIKKLKYSNDGKLLSFILEGMSLERLAKDQIQIWNTETRTHLATFYGYEFCFASDNQFIAIATMIHRGGSTITVYKLPNFELAFSCNNVHASGSNTLRGNATISALLFSPRDKEILVSCGSEGSILLWNISERRQEPTAQLHGHTPLPTTCLAFSPDGNILASGGGQLGLTGHKSGDRKLKIWNMKNILPLSKKIHQGPINSLILSKCGEILTAGRDGTIKRWSAENGKFLNTTVAFKEENKVGNQVIKALLNLGKIYKNHDAEYIMVLNGGGKIKIFQLAPNELIEEKFAFQNQVQTRVLAVSLDAKRLAVGGPGKILNIVDLESGQLLFYYEIETTSLAFAIKESNWLAVKGYNMITVIDSKNGEIIFKAPKIKSDSSYLGMGTITFSPIDSHKLAVYCDIKANDSTAYALASKHVTSKSVRIIVWDIYHKKKMCKFTGHKHSGAYLCFSPDGKYLLSASVKGELIVIDVGKQIEVGRFEVEKSCVTSIQFITENCFFISSTNGFISSWELVKNSNSKLSLSLKWSIVNEVVLSGASFKNVKGLEDLDRQLFSQKGAFVTHKEEIYYSNVEEKSNYLFPSELSLFCTSQGIGGFISIEGDGNCFFRAVLVALREDEDEHLLLRTRAVQYIRDNPRQFPEGGFVITRGKIEMQVTAEEYLQYMEQNNQYAEGAIIAATGMLQRVSINVLSLLKNANGEIEIQGKFTAAKIEDAPYILLLFVNSNHYHVGEGIIIEEIKYLANEERLPDILQKSGMDSAVYSSLNVNLGQDRSSMSLLGLTEVKGRFLQEKFSRANNIYGIFKTKYRNSATRGLDETVSELQEAKEIYKQLLNYQLDSKTRTQTERRLEKLKNPISFLRK